MKLSRNTIVGMIESLFSETNIDAGREIWTIALTDYSNHPKLSITDCFLAAQCANTHRIPLYTFDDKLAKQIKVAQHPK
jgi:predicted nucleic acid-binding protein